MKMAVIREINVNTQEIMTQHWMAKFNDGNTLCQ